VVIPLPNALKADARFIADPKLFVNQKHRVFYDCYELKALFDIPVFFDTYVYMGKVSFSTWLFLKYYNVLMFIIIYSLLHV
jgi:hypothetical protein